MPSRESFEKLTVWYERRIAPFAFIGGFIFDLLTLTRLDVARDHIILTAHLLIAGTGIVLIHASGAGRLRGHLAEYSPWLAPLMIQFSVGALFSNSVILYGRSGSIAASWPFLGSLFMLLIGNEFLRERYHRFLLHISVYLVALTSYAIIALPVFARRMGPAIFVAGTIVSLALTGILILLLGRISRDIFRNHARNLLVIMLGIFALFNLLYFTNIIPPIPLALKQLKIVHSVERTSDGYILREEPSSWIQALPGFHPVYHWVRGTPLYAASAVFAPTAIKNTIVHHWLFWNPAKRVWEEKAAVPFGVQGGRGGGYRGYTRIRSVEPGRWRVDVRTDRGQLLGRISFSVEAVSQEPALEVREL